jgi:TetR/AcrR family transcriptional regulator
MDEAFDTRERIMAAALDLFSRRGYETSGVQEIADAAGLTKPALYYHFGSKQGLLDAIVARFGDTLTAVFSHESEYHHNLLLNLNGLFRGVLEFANDNANFFRLLMALFQSAPETTAYTAGKELRLRLNAIIEKLFASASLDHGNMKNREKVYAETFMGLLETWARLTINGEIQMTADLEYRVIHQYMHGIFS